MEDLQEVGSWEEALHIVLVDGDLAYGDEDQVYFPLDFLQIPINCEKYIFFVTIVLYKNQKIHSQQGDTP